MQRQQISATTLELHRLFSEVARQGSAPTTEQQGSIYRLLFAGPGSPVAAMIRKYLSRCDGYRRLLQSTADETDLMNDTFVALVHALEAGQYSGEQASPFGFVKTIAIRWIRGQALRGRTRAKHTSRLQRDDQIDPVELVPDGPSADPSIAFDQGQVKEWTERLASRLSESDRNVLRARYTEDLSHEAIAKRLGKPSAGASRIGLMRIHRRIEEMIRDMPGCESLLRGAMTRLAAAA